MSLAAVPPEGRGGLTCDRGNRAGLCCVSVSVGGSDHSGPGGGGGAGRQSGQLCHGLSPLRRPPAAAAKYCNEMPPPPPPPPPRALDPPVEGISSHLPPLRPAWCGTQTPDRLPPTDRHTERPRTLPSPPRPGKEPLTRHPRQAQAGAAQPP